MNKAELILAERIHKNLVPPNISISKLLGIQTQFPRYAKISAELRGIHIDSAPERYFKAWTLHGAMHIHEINDYAIFAHEGISSQYMAKSLVFGVQKVRKFL